MGFNLIEDLINEHGSATILGQRLSLIKDQLNIALKKVGNLEKENAELKNEISELKKKIEEIMIPKDFTEYRGVLFRRFPTGEFEGSVYCLEHKMVMSSLQGLTPYKCSKCGFKADFTGQDLPKILDEVVKRFS